MKDAVQQIKDRMNILDVVSPYVELHKAGKNFKGKSPFTAERTPSFFVSPDRGMYYCFSTSQGGDIFNFVQVMEGVDFKEALRILAEKAGVELIPEAPEKRTERDRAYSALTKAAEFYHSWLEDKPEAKEYLLNRGVKEMTIKKWQIGYAPGPPDHGWRTLKDHLEKKGYTKEELFKVGLIKSTDGGKEPFDVFRDRIMFPLSDSGGRTVAFSGRILNKNSEAPKYVNSPETDLYKKSELLFGFDKAKTGIRGINFSLIVEGQFDVVMCHQAGYNNTVAVSGTALTLQHVKLLERLSDRVVLALDSDRAGIAAMKKASELMLSRGLDVKVARMPEGSDPADVILDDPSKFKKSIGKAVHIIEFLLEVLKSEYSDPRTLKLKAREEILPFVILLPNRIDQDHFIDVIAKSIGSTRDSVRFELGRLREEKNSPVFSSEDKEVLNPRSQSDVVESVYTYLKAVLPIIDGEVSKALEEEITKLQSMEELKISDESELAKTSFILEQQFAKLSPVLIHEEVIAKLNQLRDTLIKRKLQETRTELKEAELAQDDEAIERLLNKIKELEIERRKEPYIIDNLLKNTN